MQIVAEDSLKEGLEKNYASFADQNFCLVQLEQKQHQTDLRQQLVGLDIALGLVEQNRDPIIIFGFLSPEMCIQQRPREWFALMGYPHVVYGRIPETLRPEGLQKAIDEVRAGVRQPDPLAIALLHTTQREDTIGILRHDLCHAQRDENRMKQWEETARGIFGEKTRDELIALVETIFPDRNIEKQPFAGRKFPDVCVDMEGTLFDGDGNFRPEILSLAEEKANSGPITIWTGGNINGALVRERKKRLYRESVCYKIIAKQTLSGAGVKVVIDDMPEWEFQATYSIRYEEYIQV